MKNVALSSYGCPCVPFGNAAGQSVGSIGLRPTPHCVSIIQPGHCAFDALGARTNTAVRRDKIVAIVFIFMDLSEYENIVLSAIALIALT
jgi:hypothetical protein